MEKKVAARYVLPEFSSLERELAKEYAKAYKSLPNPDFDRFLFAEASPKSFDGAGNPTEDSAKYDADLIFLYTHALAKAEIQAINTNESAESYLEAIAEESTDRDFFVRELKKNPRWRKFLHNDYIIAWYADKKRASRKGFIRAGKEISTLRAQGLQKELEKIAAEVKKIPKSFEDLENEIEKSYQKTDKRISRVRKYAILISAGFFLALGVSKGIDIYAWLTAKDTLEAKEQKWENILEHIPTQYIGVFEDGVENLVLKYIKLTGYKIDENQPFEKQIVNFWNEMTENAKEDFIDYVFNNLQNEEKMQKLLQGNEEQMKMLIEMIVEEFFKKMRAEYED
jgi:hypothetical protein